MFGRITHFINGSEVCSETGETYQVINPATKQEIARACLGNKNDVDKAVKAAREAWPKWKFMKAIDRARILQRIADKIGENRELLATQEVAESGWPYTRSKNLHVDRCMNWFHYFASTIDKLSGRVVPVDPDYLSFTSYEPYGVVALLLPWNAPLSGACLGLSAALACGNTVIMKPSEETPIVTFTLAKLCKEAGVPDGVVNVLIGTGSEVGRAIAEHPGVDKIVLTGGVETGKAVMRSAASSLASLTCELGGKTPVLVFPDADIDTAAKRIAYSAFMHQGQICTAASRLLLHQDIYEVFLKKLRENVAQLCIGDPLDPQTQIGPVISEKHFNRILRFIEEGKKTATLYMGGELPTSEELKKGFYMLPTVFTDVDPQSTIAQTEIFGPVLSVIKFTDEDEALEIANGVIYGLGSSIWTKDLQRAHYLAKRLEAGLVWINCLQMGDPAMPHGGFKQSGFGLENGLEAVLHSYSRLKSTWVNIARE